MNKNSVRKSIRRLTTLGIGCILLLSTIFISTGRSLYQIKMKKDEQNQLEENLYDLRGEEENLSAEYLKLSDPAYIARYAREKYLYSKDGEFIIRIP